MKALGFVSKEFSGSVKSFVTNVDDQGKGKTIVWCLVLMMSF